MNSDYPPSSSTRDPPRWRDGVQVPLDGHRPAPLAMNTASPTMPPQLSAPTAIYPASHAAVLDPTQRLWHHDRSHADYAATSPGDVRRAPASEHDGTNAPSYSPGRPDQRHFPAPGGDRGPQQLANTSPGQTSPGAWQSLHQNDRRPSLGHAASAPLTVQIPPTQDFPRFSPVSTTMPSESHSLSSSSLALTPPTSLPSFKAFKEHTTRTDDVDGPEIAPMSSRLSCYLCTKLKPMLREVATAVAEFDESLQTYCNKTNARPVDMPSDSPVRTVQWIIDRLRYAKTELVEASQQPRPGYGYGQVLGASPGFPGPGSPNPLKRSAEPWEREDLHGLKRPRSGASVDLQAVLTPRDERCSSIDFPSRDAALQHSGNTPPFSDSAPNSAVSKALSPSLTSRGLRSLPSPSSLAYPPSAVHSLPPPTVQSAGSPAPSYQPTASIHTASTNSATSAHLADLQHQVTLKSLALQTLQGEYASLLQKLQRERVKSQTIEKKTTVADQEVNDLTTKNEELTELVKSLESQLDESEKKRGEERAEAVRDKEQWGRMLEMGGRLQAKGAEEKQRLIDEKAYLSRRVAFYEEEDAMRFDQIKKDLTSRRPSPGPADHGSVNAGDADSAEQGISAALFSSTAEGSPAELKREIAILNARIDVLRHALKEVKRQTAQADAQARDFLHHTTKIDSEVERALQDYELNSRRRKSESGPGRAASGRSTPLRQKPQWTSAPAVPPRSEPLSPQDLDAAAQAGHAVSPTPAELGFDVVPSTSSPEELIRALGPIPAHAPVPSLQSQKQPRQVNPQERSGRQSILESAQPAKDTAKDLSTSRWVEATGTALHLPHPQPHHVPIDRSSPRYDPARTPPTAHSSSGDVIERSSSSGSARGLHELYHGDNNMQRQPSALQPLRVQSGFMPPRHQALSAHDYSLEAWTMRSHF